MVGARGPEFKRSIQGLYQTRELRPTSTRFARTASGI